MATLPIYYKVVETIENGEKRIAAVPGLWETNGKLMWPPKSKQKKALKNPLLQPGTQEDGWVQFDCTVVRNYIPTYANAVQELKAMSDHSDTSDAELISFPCMLPPQQSKHNLKRKNAGSVIINGDADRINFNSVCASYICFFRNFDSNVFLFCVIRSSYWMNSRIKHRGSVTTPHKVLLCRPQLKTISCIYRRTRNKR